MVVRRVETEDLVGVSEIADRCGVSRQAVSNWRSRFDSFPEPLVDLECGPVFYWPKVLAWVTCSEEDT